MQLQVMSDIHVESWERLYGSNWLAKDFLPAVRTDADILVIAGDFVSLRESQLARSAELLKVMCDAYPEVVFVAGNHCFYDTSIEKGEDALMALEVADNFNPLISGHTVTIKGQRFLGATGFQPRGGHGAMRISDHNCISNFTRSAPRHFGKFYSWLESEMNSHDILVTHHAVSNRSISPDFEDSLCNRWFITPEFEKVILEKQPKLAIHGHVHSSHDYLINNTRVVCNPRGYCGEWVKFDHQLIVDV
jgi:Icc-related predicted phosphoesterase